MKTFAVVLDYLGRSMRGIPLKMHSITLNKSAAASAQSVPPSVCLVDSEDLGTMNVAALMWLELRQK